MNSKLLSLIFACFMMTAVAAVAQEVDEQVENAADEVGDTAQDAVDETDEAMDEVGDKAENVVDDVQDQAEETADDVSDQVDETTDEAREELNEAADEVEEETDTPNEQAMLMPTTKSDDNAQSVNADKNIVELAQSQEDLSTLVEALQAAELVSTLEGDGPFTVFAPTNAAFEALPAGTLEDLLKPENKDKLTEVLSYHVIPQKAMSADLSDGQSVATVEGSDVNVMIQDGNVMVDGAKVVQADVEASNGVVHIIDAVILPSSMTDVAKSDEEKEEGQY